MQATGQLAGRNVIADHRERRESVNERKHGKRKKWRVKRRRRRGREEDEEDTRIQT